MKRITLTVVAVLLAVPVAALAKTGVGFQTDPSEVATGKKQQFTVALLHEPRGPNGRAHAFSGHARPIVTFRSGSSGRVVRVRASALLSGMATGTVALPDRGPWRTSISYLGRTVHGDGERGPGFFVGTAAGHSSLVEIVRPPAEPVPGHAGRGGFTWWPLLLIVPALAGGALLARRRRPRGLREMGAGGGA